MPQSLSQIWLHIIFSTKTHRPFLQRDSVRLEMFRMLGHHIGEAGCTPVRVGGWIDHVHLVCGLSRTVTVAQLVEHVKSETSKWAKQAPHSLKSFAWQTGYGAFSVSQSNLQRVVNYVDRQAEHHRETSFKEEFRTICRLHKVEIDERYVWD